MTTLYKPVLIESAEQAEALPVGTLAISSEMYDDGHTMHWAAVKVGTSWARTDVADGLPLIHDAAMVDADVPWTALVPIEAEEERTRPVHLYATTIHVAPSSSADKPSRRLVTPWEEA